MTKDELIKEKLLETASNNTYMNMLGIEFIDIKPGYAKSKMKVTPSLYNPYNSVHGGCLYSMADVTAGFAACTYGNYASTISGNMNYLRPAMNTEYIYCVGQVVRHGKKMSVYNVELFNDDGDLLENGTFTFYTLNTKVC